MEKETDATPQTASAAGPPSVTTGEPNLLDLVSGLESPHPEGTTDGGGGVQSTQNGIVSLLDDPVVPKTEEATSANDTSPPLALASKNGHADEELAEPSSIASNPTVQESATPEGGESIQGTPQDPSASDINTTSAKDEGALPSDEHPSTDNAVSSETIKTPSSSPAVMPSPGTMVDLPSPPPTPSSAPQSLADTKDETRPDESLGGAPLSSDGSSDTIKTPSSSPAVTVSPGTMVDLPSPPPTPSSAPQSLTDTKDETRPDESLGGAPLSSDNASLSVPPVTGIVELPPPSTSQPAEGTNDSVAQVPVSSENAQDATETHAASSLSATPVTVTGIVEFPPPTVSQPAEGTNDSAAQVPVSSENAQDATAQAQQKKIDTLQAELAKAQTLIESVLQGEEQRAAQEDTSSLLMELQSTLQQQMSLKAEAENKVRLVNDRIQRLETQNKELAIELAKFSDLEMNLDQQMSSKAEAENKVRLVNDRVQQLEAQNKKQVAELCKLDDLEMKLQQQISFKAEAENKTQLAEQRIQQLENDAMEQAMAMEKLQRELVTMREERAGQQQEVQKMRDLRAEHERKEMALTNRLNAAKKKEATKANLAEQYEEDVNSLEQELQDVKQELQECKESKQRMERELRQACKTSLERFHEADRSLTEERSLNEERKRKMKAFVENRSEELRQAKEDNDALQTEVTQTNRALMDLNNRWKQLHAQWVQSQTRNRELQRDLNRIKKDSENLHRVGDTLEMKLSRSANETEEHKNKRLAAKHELMTVLRTLEAEREVSNKLRDSIKYTFTPKALSQQQLLKESLEEFKTQLLKLSQRLGKPLPPANASGDVLNDLSESTTPGDDVDIVEATGDGKRSEADMNRLIAKLEYETQHVSQCILALTGGVERMHLLLDASGNRTCYTALSEILTTGNAATAATHEETTSMTGGRRLASIHSSPRYGQVPGASSHH
jgi:hypothetical protein